MQSRPESRTIPRRAARRGSGNDRLACFADQMPSEQRMDAAFTVGQYNLVSWALNSFRVPLDDFLPGAARLALCRIGVQRQRREELRQGKHIVTLDLLKNLALEALVNLIDVRAGRDFDCDGTRGSGEHELVSLLRYSPYRRFNYQKPAHSV